MNNRVAGLPLDPFAPLPQELEEEEEEEEEEDVDDDEEDEDGEAEGSEIEPWSAKGVGVIPTVKGAKLCTL